MIESLPRIHIAKGYLFTTTGATAVSGFSRAKEAIDKAMGSPPIGPFTTCGARPPAAWPGSASSSR